MRYKLVRIIDKGPMFDIKHQEIKRIFETECEAKGYQLALMDTKEEYNGKIDEVKK